MNHIGDPAEREALWFYAVEVSRVRQHHAFDALGEAVARPVPILRTEPPRVIVGLNGGRDEHVATHRQIGAPIPMRGQGQRIEPGVRGLRRLPDEALVVEADHVLGVKNDIPLAGGKEVEGAFEPVE